MTKFLVWAVQTFSGRKTLGEFKHMRAEIDEAFEFFAKVDTTIPILPQGPQSLLAEQARLTYRRLAGRVYVFAALPFHKRWLLPSSQNLESAKMNLYQLCNETGKSEAALENANRQDRVREALKTVW